MANPTFYYYPDNTGSLHMIDLGTVMSDIQETPMRTRVSAKGGDGGMYVSVYEGGLRVRLVRERGVSAAVARKLMNMFNFLERGGSVGFARDHAKAWAQFTSSPPTRGASGVYVNSLSSAFTGWSTAAALVAGDEVVIESAQPELIREYHTISSFASHIPLGLAETVEMTAGSRCIVRHRDFFPALKLPDDGVNRIAVPDERRLTRTLDLTLEVDYAIIEAAYQAPGPYDTADSDGSAADTLPLAGANDLPSGMSYSLDSLLSSGVVQYNSAYNAYGGNWTRPTR